MSGFASHAQYKKVVIDAGVAIRLQRPESLGEECHITSGVYNEIKDPRARMHLSTYMVPLKQSEPTAKDVAWVRSFAAKTGDIGFLSDNDINIIALAYMMQRMTGNVKNLKLKPADVTVVGRGLGHAWAPPKEDNRVEKKEGEQSTAEKSETPAAAPSAAPAGLQFKELTEEEMEALEAEMNADYEEEARVEAEQQKLDDEAAKAREEAATAATAAVASETVAASAEDIQKTSAPSAKPLSTQVILIEGDKEILEEIDGEDCGEWVTSKNFKHFGAVVSSANPTSSLTGPIEDEIALVSTDFSVQNVAIQMGLTVASVHGMKVRSVKIWAQICTSCNHMERDTTKQFCPTCGYPNFRRVPLVVDQRTGEVRVHDNPNRKFNLRGINYSIPKMKGGRHNDIIFCEAQLKQNNREFTLQAARKKYAKAVSDANPFNDSFGSYAERGWWGAAKANIGGKNNAHKSAPSFEIGMGKGNPNSNRFTKRQNT